MALAAKKAKVTKKSTLTCSSTQYYLVGHSKAVGRSKLSTLRQMQETSPHGHPVKTSIARAVDEAFSFWMMARIKSRKTARRREAA